MTQIQELMRVQPTLLQDIQNTRELAESLMKTKHYQQLGADGIFAVIQKAKSLNINSMEALNGVLYLLRSRTGRDECSDDESINPLSWTLNSKRSSINKRTLYSTRQAS